MLENQQKWAGAAVSAWLMCAGCAAHIPNYRLIGQGSGQVLVPPGVAGAAVTSRRFHADVKRGNGVCAAAADAIGIEAGKKRLRVSVRREALLNQPAGWLSAWAAAREAEGCIAPGGAEALAVEIAESLPLEPGAAFRLLHPHPTAEGDITSQTRIQVVTPILREGAAPDAPILETQKTSGTGDSLTLTVKSTANLIGYETAWYELRPKSNRIGFTILPLSAERTVNGETEQRPQPAVNAFPFSSEAAFYRLIYKADPSGLRALVVAARNRAELDQRSRALESGTDSCESFARGFCIATPRAAAVNLFLPVRVNGSQTLVHWGAPVAEAIRAAGEREVNTVLPHLMVWKLYRGRAVRVEFDRSSPSILSLVLTGGEDITWN